tara:strand:- start:59700 stop:60809 length:1110 start_codon:yes stop_codon:yes gene_type:complete
MTNCKKYLIADIYAHSAEHSMINKAFVDFFLKTNSIYLLNESHATFIGGKSGFLFKDSMFKGKLLRIINREFFKLLVFFGYYLRSIVTGRHLVILGASNLQSFFLSLVFFITRTNVSWVFHGQTESIIKVENSTYAQKIFKLAFYFIRNSNCNILFLSKHIKKELECFDTNGRFFYIPHPIPQSLISNINPVKQVQRSKLNSAIVGLLRDDKKNCNKIYDLAKSNRALNLYAIGRSHSDFIVDDNSTVNYRLWDKIYSDDEFKNAIADVQIFLYFFDENDYRATASATALDALVYGKAIFCFKNDAIESLLDGYPYLHICNSIENMADEICSFDHKKMEPKLINEFSQNLVLKPGSDVYLDFLKWLAIK